MTIAPAALELKPLFLSILGSSWVGKSYYLATAIWRLRQIMLPRFRVSFSDAYPEANRELSAYEQTLFLTPDQHGLVYIEKTRTTGPLYRSVMLGERLVTFPKPFMFLLRPEAEHPGVKRSGVRPRILYLYDNAGEHFMPGGETADTHATHHLAYSSALIFLVDVLQHPRVRTAARQVSRDPQVHQIAAAHRQDAVIAEAATRVRRLLGLPQSARLPRPVIVVLTKWDVWKALVPEIDPGAPPVVKLRSGLHAIDKQRVLTVSRRLENFVRAYAPELAATIDAVADDVVFLPVSALGCSPMMARDGQRQVLAVRPQDIRPWWVEIPLLYAIHLAGSGLVSTVGRGAADAVG